MTKKTRVDIAPDKSLIKKLGMTGYRTEQAIAELVDNSIDARLAGGVEKIDIDLDFDQKQITVSDNGHGMELDGLGDALTIARETKAEGEKLGRFGLGMKSACSHLGKSFTITTATPGSESQFTARYDEDRWLDDSSKGWTNFEIEEEKTGTWHGTTIVICKLKIPLYPNQISGFKKRFGIRYGPYLKSNQVRIRINSRDCIHAAPELKDDTKQEVTVSLPSGHAISGWVGLLERRSIKGDYGIHLYRKGRLIKAYAKFGIRHHPEVAKIAGELSLDHVPVNFHKTGFLEDSLEYREAVSGFKNDPAVIKALRSAASRQVSPSEIRSVLSGAGKNSTPALNTRISAANAKMLLRKAESFSISEGSSRLNFEFEDSGSEIYGLTARENEVTVKINRGSPAFGAFKNPLTLLGLIGIEARLLMSARDPDFVMTRNRRWAEFITNSMPAAGILQSRRGQNLYHLTNYSLNGELMPLHDHLKESFAHGFQFTGLSTLFPFLQNSYSKIVYNIQTTNGSGQSLSEVVSEYAKGFAVLLDPKPHELQALLRVSPHSKVILIREYAARLSSTWAIPEKAWLDLYVEVVKNRLTLYKDELISIMDELLDCRLLDSDRLRSLARHRKIIDSVEMYLQSE